MFNVKQCLVSEETCFVILALEMTHSYWFELLFSLIGYWFLLFSHCVLFFCDPMHCSPPGCPVHGISRVRILVPFPSPGDLPDSGIKPESPALQMDSLPLSHQGSPLVFVTMFKEQDDLDWEEQQRKAIPFIPVMLSLIIWTSTYLQFGIPT